MAWRLIDRLRGKGTATPAATREPEPSPDELDNLGLLRQPIDPRRAKEATLPTITDYVLADGVIGDRRFVYLHQVSDITDGLERGVERGVLSVYRPGSSDVEFEFYSTHIKPSKPVQVRTDNRFERVTSTATAAWGSALEQIVYRRPDGGGDETYRKPTNGPFEFVDPMGRVARDDAHDPIEKEIVTAAKIRYEALSANYAGFLRQAGELAKRDRIAQP